MAGLEIDSLTDGIKIDQLAGFLIGEVLTSQEIDPKSYLVPPDITSLFGKFKRTIMADINKVSIGIVSSFDSLKQTAQIELVFMRVIGQELMKYPTLVDVPCICLQGDGGDARMTVPIKAGDMALVLFCDRDIDNWFAGADLSAPNSERLHDLSDGIAIVGLGRGLPDFNQDGPEMKGKAASVSIKNNKIIMKNASVSYGFELAAMWACKILMTAATIAHDIVLKDLFTALAADTGLNGTSRAAATTAAGGTTTHSAVYTAQGAIEVQQADNIGIIIDGSGV